MHSIHILDFKLFVFYFRYSEIDFKGTDTLHWLVEVLTKQKTQWLFVTTRSLNRIYSHFIFSSPPSLSLVISQHNFSLLLYWTIILFRLSPFAPYLVLFSTVMQMLAALSISTMSILRKILYCVDIRLHITCYILSIRDVIAESLQMTSFSPHCL